MANVNRLALCRYCKAELTFPLPDSCPVCLNKIIKSESEYFESPAYLAFQLEDHLHDIGLHKKTAGKTEQIKAQKIARDLARWCRECPTEDKIATLSDSRMIVSEMIHSDMSGEDLQKLVKVAIQIGEIAKKVDEYVKSGGSKKALPLVETPERTEEEFLDTNKIDME